VLDAPGRFQQNGRPMHTLWIVGGAWLALALPIALVTGLSFRRWSEQDRPGRLGSSSSPPARRLQLGKQTGRRLRCMYGASAASLRRPATRTSDEPSPAADTDPGRPTASARSRAGIHRKT